MPITIHINSIPAGSEDLMENFDVQMDDSYGQPDQTLCKQEDEGVEDSMWDCYYHYSDLSFDDVDWDYLGSLGEENEVYVLVYDHQAKTRKGFWYDEDAEWIEQNTGVIEDYESLV
jgi:hypothetical protein